MYMRNHIGNSRKITFQPKICHERDCPDPEISELKGRNLPRLEIHTNMTLAGVPNHMYVSHMGSADRRNTGATRVEAYVGDSKLLWCRTVSIAGLEPLQPRKQGHALSACQSVPLFVVRMACQSIHIVQTIARWQALRHRCGPVVVHVCGEAAKSSKHANVARPRGYLTEASPPDSSAAPI
eukprot:jgi/Botrbrau1/10928/Bobra.0025s0101.1